jgi:hypothetical protein
MAMRYIPIAQPPHEPHPMHPNKGLKQAHSTALTGATILRAARASPLPSQPCSPWLEVFCKAQPLHVRSKSRLANGTGPREWQGAMPTNDSKRGDIHDALHAYRCL